MLSCAAFISLFVFPQLHLLNWKFGRKKTCNNSLNLSHIFLHFYQMRIANNFHAWYNVLPLQNSIKLFDIFIYKNDLKYIIDNSAWKMWNYRNIFLIVVFENECSVMTSWWMLEGNVMYFISCRKISVIWFYQ